LALSVTNAHLDPRVVADIAQDGGTTGHYSSWWGGAQGRADQDL